MTNPSEFDKVALRDLFAMKCPESEIERVTGKTVGVMLAALIEYGVVSPDKADRQLHPDVFKAYDQSDVSKLRNIARYVWADEMLKAREYSKPVLDYNVERKLLHLRNR